MQDINHPDLFRPALDRLIAGAPSTSRMVEEFIGPEALRAEIMVMMGTAGRDC